MKSSAKHINNCLDWSIKFNTLDLIGQLYLNMCPRLINSPSVDTSSMYPCTMASQTSFIMSFVPVVGYPESVH